MIKTTEPERPDALRNHRSSYATETKRELGEWERRLVELRDEHRSLSGELGDRTDQQLLAARRALIWARARMDALEGAGGETWNELRFKTDRALAEVREAWERLVQRVR